MTVKWKRLSASAKFDECNMAANCAVNLQIFQKVYHDFLLLTGYGMVWYGIVESNVSLNIV